MDGHKKCSVSSKNSLLVPAGGLESESETRERGIIIIDRSVRTIVYYYCILASSSPYIVIVIYFLLLLLLFAIFTTSSVGFGVSDLPTNQISKSKLFVIAYCTYIYISQSIYIDYVAYAHLTASRFSW